MDSSPPGSSVHGILQARILEWVAISSSKGSSQPRDQTHVSCGFCIARGFFIPELPGKPQWKYQSWSMSPTEIDRNDDMWLLRLDQNRQCIFHLSDTHYQEGWPLSHCCCCLVSKSCLTLWDLSPWDSPGKHTGVGSHSLFRGFSQPKFRTWVSCIESRFFAIWPPGNPGHHAMRTQKSPGEKHSKESETYCQYGCQMQKGLPEIWISDKQWIIIWVCSKYYL